MLRKMKLDVITINYWYSLQESFSSLILSTTEESPRGNTPIWPRSSTLIPLCSTFFPETGSTEIWKEENWILTLLNNQLRLPVNLGTKFTRNYTLPVMFSWLWKSGTITVWPFSFFSGTYSIRWMSKIAFNFSMFTLESNLE